MSLRVFLRSSLIFHQEMSEKRNKKMRGVLGLYYSLRPNLASSLFGR